MKINVELDDDMRRMFAALPGDHQRLMFKEFLDQATQIVKEELRERLIDYLEDLRDTPGLEE